MTDIIALAESRVYAQCRGTDRAQARIFSELVIDLIAELKSTREQLQCIKENR